MQYSAYKMDLNFHKSRFIENDRIVLKSWNAFEVSKHRKELGPVSQYTEDIHCTVETDKCYFQNSVITISITRFIKNGMVNLDIITTIYSVFYRNWPSIFAINVIIDIYIICFALNSSFNKYFRGGNLL